MTRSDPDRDRIVSRLERELAGRLEIALAMLHGLYARGGRYRDIDVAVWLDAHRLSAEERFRHALDLSVQLQLAVGKPVDVRVLNDAPLAFRYHALRGRPLLVRDEAFLADLRARTWDDDIDFQPFARQYLREALSG